MSAPTMQPAGTAAPSPEGASAHAHEPVRQMEDTPNTRSIFIIGVVGIVVTVVSIYISYGFQMMHEKRLNPAPNPEPIAGTYVAQGNAGIIERGYLVERKGDTADGDAQHLKRDQEAQLQSYGWVDRTRGLIRIPIGQAMDQVVQAYGQRK